MPASLRTRDRCPVCGSTHAKEAYRRPFEGGEVQAYLDDFYRLPSLKVDYVGLFGGQDYVLDRCADCSALYQRNIPTELLMDALYGKWIANSDTPSPEPLSHFTHHVQEAMQAIAFAMRRRGETSPAAVRVLDYGLGWGVWAKAAVGVGAKVAGFDLSRQRRDHAARHGIEVLGWADLPGQAFDFINTEQVFEHLPEPLKTCQLLGSALRPGGVLKISVPTGRWLDKGAVAIDWKAGQGQRNNVNPVTPLEHINYFPRSALRAMAAEAGLAEVKFPLGLQYAYSADFHSPKRIAKNLVRPLWARYLQNILYFERPR